jgi:hypothetical protein
MLTVDLATKPSTDQKLWMLVLLEKSKRASEGVICSSIMSAQGNLLLGFQFECREWSFSLGSWRRLWGQYIRRCFT